MPIPSIKVRVTHADGSTSELNYMFTGEQAEHVRERVRLTMRADAGDPTAEYTFDMPAAVWTAIKDRS
jgi:hypothetical protein